MKTSPFMTLLALAGFSLITVAQTPPEAEPRKIQGLIDKLPMGSRHHPDVAYAPGTQPGRKPDSVQTLDLYVPPGRGPFPLVFWIHGGGWHSGDKLESGINLALKFLPKGFALASINYRLTGDAPFPAQIEDCNSALAFLRQRAESYRIDPDRVGTLGHSAGAHLAALMACTGNEKRFTLPPGHAAWDMEAWYLAHGVLALAAIVAPSRVVIGGGVSQVDGFHERIETAFRQLSAGYFSKTEGPEYVRPPALGQQAGIVGALLLAASKGCSETAGGSAPETHES